MNSPKIRFFFRALLSLALIAILLNRLDWRAVAKLIGAVYPVPLFAGALLGVTSQFLMSERTRLMLRHWGAEISFRNACSATWVGQFCNNFLPGGMGGDMVKFYRISRILPQGKAATLVALISDRLLALLALVLLSVAALALGDQEVLRQLSTGMTFGSLRGYLPAWWVLILVVAGVAAFSALLFWRFRPTIVEKGARHVHSIRAAIAKGSRFDGAIITALLLALLVHSLGMLTALCFARALAIPLGVGQVFLVWPVVLVAMMMPISVNGYGLREFILLFYFERWHLFSHLGTGAGVKESVVALSLLSVLNDMLCNLPGGLLLLGETPIAAQDGAAGKNPVATPGL